MPQNRSPAKPEEQRVKSELRRLNKIFNTKAGIDKNKLEFVKRQIEQLAWYNVAIEDLQKKIDECGTILSYNNGGGQSGSRQNPDLKTMNDYQKAAISIVKTLLPIVPEKHETGGDLDAFREIFDCR